LQTEKQSAGATATWKPGILMPGECHWNGIETVLMLVNKYKIHIVNK